MISKNYILPLYIATVGFSSSCLSEKVNETEEKEVVVQESERSMEEIVHSWSFDIDTYLDIDGYHYRNETGGPESDFFYKKNGVVKFYLIDGKMVGTDFDNYQIEGMK